jgi:hypothetical protein
MMNRFSPDELRRAVVALDVIEQRGDRDQWKIILRQARDSAPNSSRWGNATPNQQIRGAMLAADLSSLLGADREQCEEAAAEVVAPQQHRAIYNALLSYAAELTRQSSSRNSSAATKPTQRPTVRIIADSEAA